MKNKIFIAITIILFLMAGCATNKEAAALRSAMEQSIINESAYLTRYFLNKDYLLVSYASEINDLNNDFVYNNLYKFINFEVDEENNKFILFFKNENTGSTFTRDLYFKYHTYTSSAGGYYNILTTENYNYGYIPLLDFRDTFRNPRNTFNDRLFDGPGLYNYELLLFLKETINERNAKINIYDNDPVFLSLQRPLPNNLVRGAIYIAYPNITNRIGGNSYSARFYSSDDAIVTFTKELPQPIHRSFWSGGKLYYISHSYVFKYIGHTEVVTRGGFVRVIPEFEILDLVWDFYISRNVTRDVPTTNTIF